MTRKGFDYYFTSLQKIRDAPLNLTCDISIFENFNIEMLAQSQVAGLLRFQ